MELKQRFTLKTLCIVLGAVLLLLVAVVTFDMNVDRGGWYQKGDVYYYLDFHGRKISGWQEVNGKTYYFGEDKIMVTHWQNIDGNRYYFDGAGAMATGWSTVNDRRYYFGDDGILRTHWMDLNGKRYYLGEEGALFSGWLDLDGFRYYFGENNAMTIGWCKLETGTYYFDENGHLVTGHTVLDDSRYFFQEDGVMYTGWEDTEEGRRYYAGDGIMATEWAEIDGKRYRFDENGILQTGWYQEGEYKYYLQEDGSAAVGPVTIDGQLYYFSPKGIHVVLVNTSHKVPSYYDPDLVIIQEWHQVSQVCLEPLRRMLDDLVAAGYEYTFNSAYRSIANQQEILSLRTQEYIDDGMDDTKAYWEARKSVALPGTSEHHLGLAVDLLNKAKAEKKALDWLGEHCWEYGFILRYPAEKSHITGIIYEPWHFRYVGVEVSMDMKDSGLCLEEYLGAVPIEEPAGSES